MFNLSGSTANRSIASYGYYPQAEGELELVAGDEMIVLEEVKDGWLKGKVGQREGIFPGNVVFDTNATIAPAT